KGPRHLCAGGSQVEFRGTLEAQEIRRLGRALARPRRDLYREDSRERARERDRAAAILPRLRRAPFGRSRRDDHHPLSLARASRAAVIPGRRRKRVYARLRRAMAANPESISPGCGYGFRAPSLTLGPRNDSVPVNPAKAAPPLPSAGRPLRRSAASRRC